MGSIHVRLTEEELALLRAWAAASHRSIQREIVWRLFGATARIVDPQVTPGKEERRTSTAGDDNFKPDFKQARPRRTGFKKS